MNTVSQIFGPTPKKIFENLIWWFSKRFWKREAEFLGLPLTRPFGIEERGQAKAGLRMGVETRLAFNVFCPKKHGLVGGFKYFLCSSLFGEDSHFD